MCNQNQHDCSPSPSSSDMPPDCSPANLDRLGNPTPSRMIDASSTEDSVISDDDVAQGLVVTREPTRCQQIVTCLAKFVHYTLSASNSELQQVNGLFTRNWLLFRDVTLSDYDTIRHNIRNQPSYCNILYVHTMFLHNLLMLTF